MTEKVRLGFIRKVYCILLVQLLVTLGFVLWAYFSEGFRKFQLEHVWVYYTCIPITIIVGYTLCCCGSIAKKVPINYILLFLYTFALSYLVAYMTSRYNPITLIMATSLTCAVVVGLTVYAFYTKIDFTFSIGMLNVLGIVLIVGGILAAVY